MNRHEIEILFYIILFAYIINKLRMAYKKEETSKYFKSNIITNDDINKNNKKYNMFYSDVPKEKLEKFNTNDINALKDYLYDIFIKFENAYNNLDYNIMKQKSTKQLYQKYYTGITLDLKAGRKRIISEIERKKVIIFELDSTIAKQVISTMIEISYYNYTVNKNGKIVSGQREEKITEKFEVIFRKDFSMIKKCPTCGAEINGGKCQYCRSIINEDEFKISSIKRIIDSE